jgi:hypothetical protein
MSFSTFVIDMNFLHNHFKNLLYFYKFQQICENFRTCSGYIPPSTKIKKLDFYLTLRGLAGSPNFPNCQKVL